MTAPPLYDLESTLEKAPGRSAQLRAAAQKAKDAGDFARAEELTREAEQAEREEEEAAERLKRNAPPPAGADTSGIKRPALPAPPIPQPRTPYAPPAPPPPAASDAATSAATKQEFLLRQKGAAQRNPVLLEQADQIKAQRQGVVTVGPLTSPTGPSGLPLITGESMTELASGERGLAPQIQAAFRLARNPVGAEQIRPAIRKKLAPGPASTALNIALSNAMSVFSPEAAQSATEAALERFTAGGGDASKNATLFGLAGAGGELVGTGPLLKGPSVAARYAGSKAVPAVAEGASAALRELAGQGEVRVASRAQRAAEAARAVRPAVERVAKESFKKGAEVGATMAAEGAAGDVLTDQPPKEMAKRAAERFVGGTLLGAALHALPAAAGEVRARGAGRRAVERLPEEVRTAVAGERFRAAERGTEEVAGAPEPGYTGTTAVARRPRNLFDLGAETAQRVAEEPPSRYTPTPTTESLDAVLARHPDMDAEVYESRVTPGVVTVKNLKVAPEKRFQGVGTQFMRDLTAWADANGKRLALTPGRDPAMNRKKLTGWYREHGFRPRGGNFEVSESMIRDPKPPRVREETAAYTPAEEAPRFYSRLERAIRAAPFEKGTAEQWRAALTKNVAKSEREYTGVERFLEQNAERVISRREVENVFDQGKIELKETQLGGERGELSNEAGRLSNEVNANIMELRRTLDQRGYTQTKIANILNLLQSPASPEYAIEEYGFDAQQARLARAINTGHREHVAVLRQVEGSPKYQNYTEPGGTGYREILIQHDRPSNETVNAFAKWARQKHNLTMGRVSTLLADPTTRKSFLEEFEQDTGKRLDPDAPIVDDFRSGHFDQPNILAHARVKDRTLPNGEKALFVEEIQSDWHQRGRERGYMTPEQRAEAERRATNASQRVADTRVNLSDRINQTIPEFDLSHLADPEGGESMGSVGNPDSTDRMFDIEVAGEPFTVYRYEQGVSGDRFGLRGNTRNVFRADGGARHQFQNIVAHSTKELARKLRDVIVADRVNAHPELTAAHEENMAAQSERTNAVNAPPEGPFKKTEEWMGLAMKRLIDEAVKGGYDRVVWTSGEQQKNRYNLGKAVGEIAYDPESMQFAAYDHRGQQVHGGKYDPRALADVVGKEVAQKLLQTPLKPHPDWMVAGVHSLSGPDLEVGGEGMRSFYDRMIPNWVSDYAKKMGVKLDIEPSKVFGRPKQEIDAEIQDLIREYEARGEEEEYTSDPRYAQLMRERTYAPDRPDNAGYTGTVPTRQVLEDRLERSGALASMEAGDAPEDPVDLEVNNILNRIDKYGEDMHTAIERVLEELEIETDHETAQIVAHELGGEWIPRRKEGVGENLGFRVTPELKEKVQREGQPVLSPTKNYKPTTARGEKLQHDLRDLGDEDAPVAAAALEDHLAAQDAEQSVDSVARGLQRRVPGLKAWSASRSTLTELMKKRHSNPIVGKKFNDIMDLALHAQIFRDPRFETLRVIYVKNHGGGEVIVAVEGISQRLPNAAAFAHYGDQAAAMSMLTQRLSELEADGFYFQHNHPTGDPTPSGIDPRAPGDVQFQAFLKKHFGEKLRGHIIINSGSYSFLDVPEIREDGSYWPHIITEKFPEHRLPGRPDPLDRSTDPLLSPDPGMEHPHLGKSVLYPKNLAELAHQAQIGKDHVLIYHQGSHANIVALQEVPFEDIQKRTLEFRKNVLAWSRQLGTREIFAVSANPAHKATLGSLVLTGDFKDALISLPIGEGEGRMVLPAKSSESVAPYESQLHEAQRKFAEESSLKFGPVKEDLPRYRREGTGEEYAAPVDEGKDPRLVNLAKFDLDPGGEKRLRDLIEQKGYTKKRVTHEETVEVAKELGLDPERLIRNAERRLSGAELLALRDAISENVDAMESAAKVLADPQSTSPQRDEAQQLMTRLHNQTEQFTARFIREREQTGRDLNALKIIAQRSLDPAVWLAQAERIKGLALTPEETLEISQLAKGQKRPELIHFVSSLHRSTKLDKFLTLWKAGLLTAPPTHAANILGNVSMAALETAKEPLAYVTDAIISLIRGEAMSKSPSFRGLFTAQFTGAARGTKAAYKIMKTGVNPEGSSKWNLTGRTNFNNAILQGYSDLVFNSLSAEDQIFKGASFGRHLEEHSRIRAKEIARKSGGTITFKDALAQIRADVPNDVLLKAIAGAEFDTFQNDNSVSSGVTAFNRAVSKSSTLRTGSTITMPFVKTPTNVTARLFDYTPAGFFRVLDSEVRGDQKKLSEALARAGLGSSLLWYGATLAAAGLATGAMPENQAEREAWNAEGKLPNAIKIKGHWSQVGRITPAGMLVALGAQLYTAWHKAENTAEAVSGGLAATGRLITDQPFLQGISRTLGALADPANEGKRFIENTAGSVVPAIVSRTARAVDPLEREARGVTDIVKSKIPIVRESLPAKRDVFGEEVKNRQGFASTMFDPTGTRRDETTPLLAEMERLGVTPILPSSQVRDSTAGKKEQRKRTPEERRTWLTDVGPSLKQSLTLLIADPAYKALPDDQKEDLFRAVQDRVRREGRDREVAAREGATAEKSPADVIVRESIESVAETIQNKQMRDKIVALARSAAKGDFAPLSALPDSTKEKLGGKLVTAQRDTVRKELDRLLAARVLDPDKLRATAAQFEALGGNVDDLVKRRIQREQAVEATVNAAKALRK